MIEGCFGRSAAKVSCGIEMQSAIEARKPFHSEWSANLQRHLWSVDGVQRGAKRRGSVGSNNPLTRSPPRFSPMSLVVPGQDAELGNKCDRSALVELRRDHSPDGWRICEDIPGPKTGVSRDARRAGTSRRLSLGNDAFHLSGNSGARRRRF